MKAIIQKIIGCVLLACMTGPVWAQNNADKDQKGFDATDKAFQRRFKYPDEVPFDTIWKNNISFSMFAGMDKFVPRGKGDFNTGPVAGLSMNWRWTPIHSVRAGLQYGRFGRQYDNEILTRLGIQADYLLNISAFLKGYNPGRLFEISAMGGVGYQFASFLNEKEHAADLHLGLQLKLHPTAQMDFYLEPRVSFLSDGIDHSDQKNWHKYDITYGAVVGMTYHLKPWKPIGKLDLLDGDKFLDNTFISVSGGGQFQISRLTSDVGLFKAIGPHMAVSAGKWLIPSFALRASVFKSADTWHSKILENGDQIYEMSTYAGARLEGMLNVMYFLKKSEEEEQPFSVNLLAGGEVGSIKKENGFNPAKGGYTGFTGGVQFKYRLFDELSVFVEPRITMASFTLKTNKQVEGKYIAEKYTDNLFSLNLGLEMGWPKEETRLERSVNDEYFVPHFFANAGLGMGMPLQMKRFHLKNYLNYQAMIAGGYNFTPLSSVRLSGDFGPYSIDLKSKALKYNMASVGLDYMLNLSNLMMQYVPERKYDVQWLAGIVGSMRMKPSTEIEDEDLNKSKFFIGLETGIHASYKVMDFMNLKVFVEPKIRLYSKDLLKQSSIQGYDTMLMMHVGTSCTF